MAKNKPITIEDLKDRGLTETAPGMWERVKTAQSTLVAQKAVKIKEKPPKYGNKKTVLNGIIFDSGLEAHFYRLLILVNIKFRLKVEYVLHEGFVYGGEKIKPSKIIPDFIIYDNFQNLVAIVDTKGRRTAKWSLQFKLLKYQLFKQGIIVPIFTPSTKAECQKVIDLLLINRGISK